MDDAWSAAVFIIQSQTKGRNVTRLYCLTAAEQRQASNLAVLSDVSVYISGKTEILLQVKRLSFMHINVILCYFSEVQL